MCHKTTVLIAVSYEYKSTYDCTHEYMVTTPLVCVIIMESEMLIGMLSLSPLVVDGGCDYGSLRNVTQ